jgi:hypothetical protein
MRLDEEGNGENQLKILVLCAISWIILQGCNFVRCLSRVCARQMSVREPFSPLLMNPLDFAGRCLILSAIHFMRIGILHRLGKWSFGSAPELWLLTAIHPSSTHLQSRILPKAVENNTSWSPPVLKSFCFLYHTSNWKSNTYIPY